MIGSPLDQWPTGQPGRVCSLDESNRAHLQKLLSLGILPGSRFVVRRKFPALVLEIDATRYALDRTLARCIYVEREPEVE